MSKIALAMIIKGSDREAELLDRCLGGVQDKELLRPELREADLTGTDGIAKHVDGIYITLTQENENVRKVAAKYGANVSFMEWEHDFAKARNFNFAQVPKEFDYIVWTDADDLWWQPENIKPILEKGVEEAVDIIHFNYMYHFDPSGACDTQHRKTRIVKNDGCVEWIGGRLHEDFSPQRQIIPMLSLDAAVYHLSDEEGTQQSIIRNIELSEMALNDLPDDPRSYWNLANAYNMGGQDAKSIPIYLQFLELSHSEDEKYLAWHRMAIAYSNIGDLGRAIGCEQEAISIKPWFPDAYFEMGNILIKQNKLKHAKEFIDMGLSKEIPKDEIIVWNPREYDYNPHLALARIAVNMAKPRVAMRHLEKCLKVYPNSDRIKGLMKGLQPEVEKFDKAEKIYKKASKMEKKEDIKKLLDKVPEDMKYYPAIVNLRNTHFIKETSSGKDLVIYCGYTDNEWSPAVFENEGVGGSEESIVQLAKRWQAAGWNVTVYCSTPRFQEYEFDNVKWKPFMAWNYRDKQDAVVLWRHPKAVDYGINCDNIIIDIHDVISPKEFTAKRMEGISKIVFKSETHKKFCDIPEEKAPVIFHGLDGAKFDERRKVVKKNPYKIINTSSPDRSLLTCLKIIKRVHEKLPDDLKPKLKFRWNYGFKVWDTSFKDNEEMIAWKAEALTKLEEMKREGIVEEESGDMISQNEVIDQYLESGLLLYPSEFFEIGFISGIKGALAGAIPVTTDAFAQGEFLSGGIIVHSDADHDNWFRDIKSGVDFGVQKEEQIEEFVDKIVAYMKNPDAYEDQRNKLIDYARSTFDWNETAASWLELF